MPSSASPSAFPASRRRRLGTARGLRGRSTARSASPCAPASRQSCRDGYLIQPPASIPPHPNRISCGRCDAAGRDAALCTRPGQIRWPSWFGLLTRTGACHHRPAKQNERPCGRSKLPNSGGEDVAQWPCGERKADGRQYPSTVCAARLHPCGHRSGDSAPTRLFRIRASSKRRASRMPQCALCERTSKKPSITCIRRLDRAAPQRLLS